MFTAKALLSKFAKSVAKKKSSKWIKCYEREGYGHIASDCGNRKPKKMTFNVKRSKFEKPTTTKEKFIAFMATSDSVTLQVSYDDGTDHNESELETEHD